jgi:hypothetical protein
MKIIKNTLELITETWSDPGDYPNALAKGPLPSTICVEDIKGHIIIQIEKSDKDNEEWEQWGAELNMHYLMQDVRINLHGVLIEVWQFCPETHHNPNDAADLDMWTLVPYKWNSDNFEL